jgi:hypothetical protein
MIWQERLIRRYPNLFVRPFRGVGFAPGYPHCPNGWQQVVTRLVERVAAVSQDGTVSFVHMVSENGILRVHWRSRSELQQRTALRIEEATALAEARSACTCVDCGAEGRLFAHDFLLSPFCTNHQRGTAVPVIAGFHDVHLHRGVVRSRPALLRVRYDWESDAFVEVSPADQPRGEKQHG